MGYTSNRWEFGDPYYSGDQRSNNMSWLDYLNPFNLVNTIYGIYDNEKDRKFAQQQFQEQQKWTQFYADREENWRNQDIALASQWRSEDQALQQQWRNEDIERNSLAHRMGELRSQGLHPSLAATGGYGGGAMSGAVQGRQAPMTGSGGRVPRPVSSPNNHIERLMTTAEIESLKSTSALNIAHAQMFNAQSNLYNQEAAKAGATTELTNTQRELLQLEVEHYRDRYKWEMDEINSRIISSSVNDELTNTQKDIALLEFGLMVRDDKIIREGNNLILSKTATLDQVAADLFRAGSSRDNIKTFFESVFGTNEEVEEKINSAIQTLPPVIQQGLEVHGESAVRNRTNLNLTW